MRIRLPRLPLDRSDLTTLLGLALLVLGVGMVFPPAAIAVAGVVLIVLAIVSEARTS